MLRKEDVYINLKGKSEEERKEIVDFLITINEDYEEHIKINIQTENYLECYLGVWFASNELENKQEVTIQQLKEILQPMDNKEEQLRKEVKERGYTHDNFKCLMDRKPDGIKDINKWCYNEFNDTLYSNTDGNGGNVVYKNGVWAEIKNNNLTLEQQLEKAEAEVKRLKEAIEDINKPNIGDWMKRGTKIFKVDKTHCLKQLKKDVQLEKIQDQELINKLNELIK